MQKAKLQIKTQNLIRENPRDFVRNECPKIWSVLNRKAKANLPQGSKGFLSGENTETGQFWLRNVEVAISHLFERLSKKEVGDCYRRDLSSVDTENKLAELLCEITLAAELSTLSSQKPVLRPKNNVGKSCDVKVNLAGTDIYGEFKRLEDPGPRGKRSIAKSPVGQKPSNTHRPRSMDIYSKLKDVHHQFPQGTVNIVFLFHPSYCDSERIIHQALYGGAFFAAGSKLQNDGLFTIKEWTNISGCAYTQIELEDGTLSIRKFWKNPRARTPITKDVKTKLEELWKK